MSTKKKSFRLLLLGLISLGVASCTASPSTSSTPASSLPATSEPAQQTSEPTPETSEPIAETSEPTVFTSEEEPETSEPAVPTSEQTAATSEQTPETSEPTAETSEPTPETSESEPFTSEPTVSSTDGEISAEEPGPQPLSSEDTSSEPGPTTSEPAPTTSEPAPTTSEPGPTTSEPAPTTSEPAPSSSVPISIDSTEPVSIDSSEPSSSSTPSIDDLIDPRWNVDFSEYGANFQITLKNAIGTIKTTTYSNCRSVGAKAAAYPNKNSNTFVPFYHSVIPGKTVPSKDIATIDQTNREHVWPDSRGGNLIQTDPIVIRPTFTKDNSSRGNNYYGIGSLQWDPAACGSEASRGEAARIILYAATAHRDKGLRLNNQPNSATSAKTMGTLSKLLEWNAKYRPTPFEKTINDRYEEMGYARNPFVDHPEYADFIYDANGFRTTPYLYVPSSSSSEPLSSQATSFEPLSSQATSSEPISSQPVVPGELPTRVSGDKTLDFSTENHIVGEKNADKTTWSEGNFRFVVEKGSSAQGVGNGSYFCNPLRIYAGQTVTIETACPFYDFHMLFGGRGAIGDLNFPNLDSLSIVGDSVHIPGGTTKLTFSLTAQVRFSTVTLGFDA